MKVAQEIDVDNVTIIINSENKLEAVPTGQSIGFSIQEVDWINDNNIVKKDVFYEINNSGTYFKGIKPTQYIKEFLLNTLNTVNSTLTAKVLKPVEESSYSYGMEKYIRTIEGSLEIDVSSFKSYNMSDNDISTVLKDFIDVTRTGIHLHPNYEWVSTFQVITKNVDYRGYVYGASNPEYQLNIRIEDSTAYLDIYEKMEFLSNVEIVGHSFQSLIDLKYGIYDAQLFYKEVETSVKERGLPVLLRISDKVSTD